MRACVAMDMGGTNLRIGVVDSAGEVLRLVKRPHGGDTSVDGVVDRIETGIRELLDWCRGEGVVPEAACLSAPGIISQEEGTVVFSPNLPGWRNVPLRQFLAERVGLTATLENDANAAAFGECWRGGGRGARNLVMFTLGTGVGGGIVADGRLVRGSRGMAGELGHLTVVSGDGRLCNCGNRGCLEAYSSATAVVRRAAGLLGGAGVPPPATALEVFERARAGDAVCLEVFGEAGRYLGVAMADMVNALNPEVIVVGGGVVDAWDLLMPAAEEEMRARAFRFTDLTDHVAVRRAELGDLAGVVGAAGIFFSESSP